MMKEHGVEVEHTSLYRWVIKNVPLLEREFRACKHQAGPNWRIDETYVMVKVTWKLWRFINGRMTRRARWERGSSGMDASYAEHGNKTRTQLR
jgi:hypothetical protein